jgi:putative molybdopterin biosynthesis protein
LLNEHYDLVIPKVHYEIELLKPLLALLHDSDFRQEVNDLGGYDTSKMGSIMAELG